MRRLAAAVFVAVVLSAPPSTATDGVVEINQACAAGSGCVAGDAGGFPVTINGVAARNFRLTSDLVVPNASITAIAVTAPATGALVSIDLNEFAIRGPTTCSFTFNTPPSAHVVSCTPLGSGVGIDGNAIARHGVIAGMGSAGARIISGEWLTASSNGGAGLELRSCQGCSASLNGGDGFFAPVGGTFSNVSAVANGGHGVNGVPPASPSGVTVQLGQSYLNARSGVRIGPLGAVSQMSADLNSAFGVEATGAGARVVANSIGTLNFGGGIGCLARCLVRENTVGSLSLTADSGYADNLIGTASVPVGVNLGGNLCGGGICP